VPSAALQFAARWSGFFEKYVLSAFFLKMAWDRSASLPYFFAAWTGDAAQSATARAALTSSFLGFLFGVFFGLSLLFNRRAVREPQRWSEIVVPLIATFILYAFSGAAPYVPASLATSLLPAAWQRDAALVALGITLAGYAVAIWSVLYLGRSLAVVVSVRELVRGGPYRFVRHPMYLGYILLVVGMFIASPSPYSLLLVASYLAITVWRARLEERALCAHSEDYRRYAARTAFLLPFAKIGARH
jgi:protein-S-isoprenylcysteine O-methyltransferase Ste14